MGGGGGDEGGGQSLCNMHKPIYICLYVPFLLRRFPHLLFHATKQQREKKKKKKKKLNPSEPGDNASVFYRIVREPAALFSSPSVSGRSIARGLVPGLVGRMSGPWRPQRLGPAVGEVSGIDTCNSVLEPQPSVCTIILYSSR